MHEMVCSPNKTSDSNPDPGRYEYGIALVLKLKKPDDGPQRDVDSRKTDDQGEKAAMALPFMQHDVNQPIPQAPNPAAEMTSSPLARFTKS